MAGGVIHLFVPGSAASLRSEGFQVAPSLKSLEFSGNIDDIRGAFSSLPFEQLKYARCVEEVGDQPPVVLALTPRLPATASLTIQLSRLDHLQGMEVSFHAPSVISHISVFRIEISEGFSPAYARQAAERFIHSFTLPGLTTLDFAVVHRESNLVFPLPWLHTEFLSLSERSSFSAHLHTLDLRDVAIMEAELLECLIVDTLLAALTWTSHSPCLVPRIRSFECHSTLQFDYTVFFNFLVSRLSSTCVQCELVGYLDHGRQLDPAIKARIELDGVPDFPGLLFGIALMRTAIFCESRSSYSIVEIYYSALPSMVSGFHCAKA
ncbi:hypothetical protein FB451DRAFT_1171603 [Mycena latifolia]|nr:hypothetical protein FB451DRAFT_1171603 [Mycena latifolia]